MDNEETVKNEGYEYPYPHPEHKKIVDLQSQIEKSIGDFKDNLGLMRTEYVKMQGSMKVVGDKFHENIAILEKVAVIMVELEELISSPKI